MQFSAPAPGMLTPVIGGWVGHWYVDETNFGHTQAEVIGLVAAALNDPDGWGRAGVSFQMTAPLASSIRFQCVESIPYGGATTIGLCTHHPDGTCDIQIEEAWITSHSVINHEAAHGFFFGEHSPEGSNSIEEPIVDEPQEDPSALDIDQLKQWLGAPLAEPPPEPQRHFFPGGLASYITHWHVPAGAKARVTATVIDPAPAIIRAVYADTHEAMLSGDRHLLCRGVATDRAGWQVTEWQDATGSGNLFVALIVEAEPGVSMDSLAISHAEAQLSGTGDDTPRQTPN